MRRAVLFTLLRDSPRVTMGTAKASLYMLVTIAFSDRTIREFRMNSSLTIGRVFLQLGCKCHVERRNAAGIKSVKFKRMRRRSDNLVRAGLASMWCTRDSQILEVVDRRAHWFTVTLFGFLVFGSMAYHLEMYEEG